MLGVNDCPSELRLDALVVGELAAPQAEETRAHVERCARCARRLGDVQSWRARFLADPPPLEATRARPRWRAPMAALGLAAAAVALFAAVPRGQAPATRTKGPSAALGFFVRHDGHVRRGRDWEVVRPGDALEFAATWDQAGWLAVMSVDGAGRKSVYLAPTAVTAGREQIVSQSTILDDTLGVETLTGVFCDQPFVPEAIPDDCQRDVVRIEKR